jgi:Ni,Fe-hydrogenase III component G
LERLRASLGLEFPSALIETAAPNRISVGVAGGDLRSTVSRLHRDLGLSHLVSISTVDTGSGFELLYHLSGPDRVVVTVRGSIPRDPARAASIADISPVAAIYERGIHDLFGIAFEGNPDQRRLLLAEDWPEGEYPLRKDWAPASDHLPRADGGGGDPRG